MTRIEEPYTPVTEYETRVVLDTESSTEQVRTALLRLDAGDPVLRSVGGRGLTVFSVPSTEVTKGEVEVSLDAEKITFTDLDVSTVTSAVRPPEDPQVEVDEIAIVPKTVVVYGVDVPVVTWLRSEEKIIRDVVRVTLDDLYEYEDGEDSYYRMNGQVSSAIEKSGLGYRGVLNPSGKKLLARLEAAAEA